jgi:membrane-bound lytic murein transglycosylase
MPRPKRRKLKFDEDSVNELLQEIYDESYNIRSQIKNLFRKWESKVKDGGEITAMGDQIIKLISAEAKNQDQKIMLLKYLKEVVYQTNKNSNNAKNDDEDTLDSKRRNELLNMVNEELKKKKK